MSAHDLGFTFKGTLMMPFDFDQSEKERRWLRNWLKRTRKRHASGIPLPPRYQSVVRDRGDVVEEFRHVDGNLLKTA